MPIEFSVAAFRLGHSMIRRAYNWNRIFDDGFGTLDLLFVFSGLQRRPRRGAASSEHLDRRLPPALRLQGGGQARPRRARSQVQPGHAHRHAARASAQDASRLPRRREQPRIPQPHAGEDGAAGDRAADGHLPEEQGRDADEAHERADPRRQQRRRPRAASRRRSGRRSSRTRRCGSTSCARPSSTRAS